MEVKINWFKESGKWYDTTTFHMSETEENVFVTRDELENHIKSHPYHSEFIAVCDEDLICYPMMIFWGN